MNTVVKPYTLDTVPEDIGINQFYCYDRRNGTIFIGDILGKSAVSPYTMYSVNGVIYKTCVGFEENARTMILGFKLKCFLDYKCFAKAYAEYLTSHKQTKKTRKTRYLVHKNTLYCKQTRAASVEYGFKEFSSKEDAEAYAYNGLKKLKVLVPKFLKEYRELQAILEYEITNLKKVYHELFDSQMTDYSQLVKAQVKPSTIKENDILIKLDKKRYGNALSIDEIDEDFTVSVKSFIKPNIAKLSNGTVLIEEECNHSYPFFFHYADKDKLAIETKMRNARYIFNIVESEIISIEDSEKYVFSYTPFNNSFKPYFFNINYCKEVLQDIKGYMQTLREKENE